jgi:hypothetical protein
MLTLCIALTVFSHGCKTNNPDVAGIFAALTPPMPSPPVEEPVLFTDVDGGLWLSYTDYRALERNIIAMREYAAKLEAVIEFYVEGR